MAEKNKDKKKERDHEDWFSEGPLVNIREKISPVVGKGTESTVLPSEEKIAERTSQPTIERPSSPNQVESQSPSEASQLDKAVQLANFSKGLQQRGPLNVMQGPMYNFTMQQPTVNPYDARTAEQIKTDNLAQQTIEKGKELGYSPISISQEPPFSNAEQNTTPKNQSNWLDALLAEHEALKAQSEKDEKADASRARLAAVSDALSSVANMIGVSKGAYSLENAAPAYKYVSDEIARNQKLRNTRLTASNEKLMDAYKANTAADAKKYRADIDKAISDNARANATEKAELQRMKLGLDERKLEEKCREFDKTYDQKDYLGKMKIQYDYLRSLNQKQIAELRIQAQADNQGQKDAEAERKSANDAIYTSIASAEDWDAEIGKIEKFVGEKLNLKYEDNLAARKKILESLAAKYPKWAESIGIKAKGGATTKAEETPKDDKEDPFNEFN